SRVNHGAGRCRYRLRKEPEVERMSQPIRSLPAALLAALLVVPLTMLVQTTPAYAASASISSKNGTATPGGSLVGVTGAGFGSVADHFDVSAMLTSPPSAEPGDLIPIGATGFIPGETLDVSFGTGPTVQSFVADPTGSVFQNASVKAVFNTSKINVTSR